MGDVVGAIRSTWYIIRDMLYAKRKACDVKRIKECRTGIRWIYGLSDNDTVKNEKNPEVVEAIRFV